MPHARSIIDARRFRVRTPNASDLGPTNIDIDRAAPELSPYVFLNGKLGITPAADGHVDISIHMPFCQGLTPDQADEIAAALMAAANQARRARGKSGNGAGTP